MHAVHDLPHFSAEVGSGGAAEDVSVDGDVPVDHRGDVEARHRDGADRVTVEVTGGTDRFECLLAGR